jgi:hypothetical protein
VLLPLVVQAQPLGYHLGTHYPNEQAYPGYAKGQRNDAFKVQVHATILQQRQGDFKGSPHINPPTSDMFLAQPVGVPRFTRINSAFAQAADGPLVPRIAHRLKELERQPLVTPVCPIPA